MMAESAWFPLNATGEIAFNFVGRIHPSKKKRFVGGVENRVTGDLELNDNPGSDAVKTEEISATWLV